MKQTRRKELKTNELRHLLDQLQEGVQRNATYLLIGLAAVVLILVIALYVRHNRHVARQQAWATYNEIRDGNVFAQPQLLDRAAELAAAQAGNPDLGPLALQLHGDMAYRLAMSLTEEKDRARRMDLLKQAQQTYSEQISRYEQRQDVRARGRMSLAAVEENLVVAGQGTADSVRKLYQQVIDDVVEGRPSVYRDLAREKLASLDKRLAPLQIIATRPAETAPATATAPAEAMPPATQPTTAATAPVP